MIAVVASIFINCHGFSGNWSVDLQAGSQFGYRPMLFVILLAGLGALVLQVRLDTQTSVPLNLKCSEIVTSL